MGPIVLLFVSLLLSTQGSLTATPVFVQTGRDLPLDVQEEVSLGEGHDLTWKFNDTNNVAKLTYGNKPVVFGSYKSRVVFSAQIFSLLVKNVQESDSGVYRARVAAETETIVAEYQVTVQGPVSPVKLTVNHCSTNSSNLTVTCSTLDSLISSTFTCDHQTCSAERGDPSVFNTPAASVHVYMETGSVICNHSNKVSREKDIIRIEDLCKKPPGNQTSKAATHTTAIAIIVSILVLTIIIAVAICSYRSKSKYKKEEMENTVYEIPMDGDMNRNEQRNQFLDRETYILPDTSPASPYSIYSQVGPHTGPVVSQEPRGNPQPESLYATVEKPAKS